MPQPGEGLPPLPPMTPILESHEPEEEEAFTCDSCGDSYPGEAQYLNDTAFCESCWGNYILTCENCDENYHTDNSSALTDRHSRNFCTQECLVAFYVQA